MTAYRVVIRTTFEPGTLKVGEVVIPGESEQTFVLVAHLCHPAMVNDDLTGVVVGLDVARRLTGRAKTALHLPPVDLARNHRLGGISQPPRSADPRYAWRAVPGDAGQRLAPCLAGLLPAAQPG